MAIRYTKDHEYVSLEGDEATIGITDYAQSQLGDVVFVDLPAIGHIFKAGDEAAVVESVKAASEVFAPIAGTVIAVNSDLEAAPATVNEDPAGTGWFFRMQVSDPAEVEALMSEEAYAAFLQSIS